VTRNRSHPNDAAHPPKIGTVDKTELVLSRSGDYCPIGHFYGLGNGLESEKLTTAVRRKIFVLTIAGILNGPTSITDGKIITHLIPSPPPAPPIQEAPLF
jgi:hypothetical protein